MNEAEVVSEFDDQNYFLGLLADYEQVRADDRAWAQLVGILFAALVALLGALAAAQDQITGGYLLAAVPVAPAAVLAFAIFVGIPGTIRSYYMRTLESEIRRMVGERRAQAPTGDWIPTLAWTTLLMEATSMRRGRPLFRAIGAVIFVCIVVAYGGLVLVTFFTVSDGLQALMAVFYSAITVLLVVGALEATIRGNKLFSSAARSLNAGSRANTEYGSFATYLIYPRPADLIKWTYVPLTAFALIGIADGRDLGVREVGIVLLVTAVFEGLLYAARYQVNDIRDYERDIGHPSADYRGRLPRGRDDSEKRTIVLTSFAVLSYRILLALTLIAILAPELLGWERWLPDAPKGMALVVLGLLLSTTVLYEWVRVRSRRFGLGVWDSGRTLIEARDLVGRETIPVWGVVGTGYALRGFVAWQAAELAGIDVPLTLVLAASVFLYWVGVMSVTEAWALEAASLIVSEEERQHSLRAGAERPHVVALLSFANKRAFFDGLSRATQGQEERVAAEQKRRADAERAGQMPSLESITMRDTRLLVERGSYHSPWQIAFVLAAATAYWLFLQTPRGLWAAGAAALLLATAAAVSFTTSSLRARAAGGAVCALLVLVLGLVSDFTWASFATLLPAITLVFVDMGFRISSHDQLVSSTKTITRSLR